LRTPLARLDIAIDGLHSETGKQANLARIETESRRIRKLVDDTLTLAWLENERPQLKQESLDLVDLIDVLAEDARFEFPDRTLDCQLPDSALIENSNHRALGQALENVLRNAMRYTPAGKTVTIALQQQKQQPGHYHVAIRDQGPGVPPQH
jgi:two-component system sensor histidine kinase PfeS